MKPRFFGCKCHIRRSFLRRKRHSSLTILTVAVLSLLQDSSRCAKKTQVRQGPRIKLQALEPWHPKLNLQAGTATKEDLYPNCPCNLNHLDWNAVHSNVCFLHRCKEKHTLLCTAFQSGILPDVGNFSGCSSTPSLFPT